MSHPARKKIAVIGAGITGMGAAERLAERHEVVLCEGERRLGGHARTVMAGRNGDRPVDTGFIVFNYATYPNLTAMFDRLEVPIAPSTMSFGASFRGGAFEYGLDGARAYFAQGVRALDPRHWLMLRDIFRFNAGALDASSEGTLSIGALMERMRLGRWFRDYYLTPFSGAIWSTPVEKILDFPAHALVRFFKNHGLLGYDEQHRWFTVQGGSRSYVDRLARSMRTRGVDMRLGAEVRAVRRDAQGVEMRLRAATGSGSTMWCSPPIPTTASRCWPTRRRPSAAMSAPSPISPTTSRSTPTRASCRGAARSGRRGTIPKAAPSAAGRSTSPTG